MSEPAPSEGRFGPVVATAPTNVATLPSGAICAREGCGKPFEPRRGGKPQKYCSARCRSLAWEALHPRITLDRAR
ncbi:MAG: hypothetical protein ABSG61_15850 [Gemmatimonadales bacterium]